MGRYGTAIVNESPTSPPSLAAPAFVDTRCYVRIGKELFCLELGEGGLGE